MGETVAALDPIRPRHVTRRQAAGAFAPSNSIQRAARDESLQLMRSWVFRHRRRFAVIFGPPAPARLRTEPGRIERRDRDVVIRPKAPRL
jgi:hypothetical protein